MSRITSPHADSFTYHRRHVIYRQRRWSRSTDFELKVLNIPWWNIYITLIRVFVVLGAVPFSYSYSLSCAVQLQLQSELCLSGTVTVSAVPFSYSYGLSCAVQLQLQSGSNGQCEHDRQYKYKRNSEERSRNHCCGGRAISAKYYECLSVALGIQHATRMRHTPYCPVCGLSSSAIIFHFIS
jgi:hypothetical protein